jgi:hypothetical protein
MKKTDRWQHYQIGEKGRRLWEIIRERSYEDDYPQGAVPVKVDVTRTRASITIPNVDPQLLDIETKFQLSAALSRNLWKKCQIGRATC